MLLKTVNNGFSIFLIVLVFIILMMLVIFYIRLLLFKESICILSARPYGGSLTVVFDTIVVATE